MFKTAVKPFDCSLTKQRVNIIYTYEGISGLGTDQVEWDVSKLECQKIRECARNDLYQNCPLRGTPIE